MCHLAALRSHGTPTFATSPPQQRPACRPQTAAAQTHARRNDAALLPAVPQDTFRRGAYARAAAELRALAAAFGQRSPAHRELAGAVAAAALPLPPPPPLPLPAGRPPPGTAGGGGGGGFAGRGGEATDERAGNGAAPGAGVNKRRCALPAG